MRLLTAALPGTGGLIKTVPEDFVVEELPAYQPSGEGPHTFLYVEKKSLTTDEAVQRLCRALGVARDDAGSAGSKDRQAVTRQWISLPDLDPARALAISVDGVRVLEAARHGNKLRTGHLRGNRFTLTVRGTKDGLARARPIVDELGRRGMPDYFGSQRFGNRGDNADEGRKLLDGRSTARMPRGQRRLLVSAYQSALFNRYLDARIDEGLLQTALAGDVLKKTDTGGLFFADDLAQAQARLDAGQVVPTGPMFGHKMMSPPEGTAARAREDAILAEEGIGPEAFATLGKLAEGTRRPLTVPVAAASVEAGPEPDSIVIRFTLPPGAYATVALAEIVKSEGQGRPGDGRPEPDEGPPPQDLPQ
jgi:tRNA pseudouridine13 synthase